MNEAQVLELIYLSQGQQLSIFQWWGGITFGLLTVAHFARKQLNLFLAMMILILYISFSVYVVIFSSRADIMFMGLLEELRFIQESTGGISAASESLLQEVTQENNPTILNIFSVLFVPGAFFGSIGYVIFAYFKGKAD